MPLTDAQKKLARAFINIPKMNEGQIKWAKKLAEEAGLNLKECFLDTENIRFPIFDEFLASTVLKFNAREYKAECDYYDCYGPKLARILSMRTTTSVSDREFDDDGHVVKDNYSSDSDSQDRYEYHDGTVQIVKNKTTIKDDTEKSFDDGIGESGSSAKGAIAKPIAEGEIRIVKSTPKMVKVVPHVESVIAKKAVGKADSRVYESLVRRKVDGKIRILPELKGGLIFNSKDVSSDPNQPLKFRVPLIKADAVTSNGNIYATECCKTLVKDFQKIEESRKNGKSKSGRSVLDILKYESDGSDILDMFPTHAPRKPNYNDDDLTKKAGIVTNLIMNGDIVYMEGQTINTQAGRDMKELILLGMVRGVSLVGYHVEFEENQHGGQTCKRLHMIGSDFTDIPAMRYAPTDDTSFKVLN